MIEIINHADCCGCSACVQICPQKIISLKHESEGFWYPMVHKSECINCGLCEKACPIVTKIDIKTTEKTYVAYARDESIRMQSSSGGIFQLIAEEVIRQGGVVFGAAFDSEFMVHHILVRDMEHLSKIRGSKYLQSRIENTYGEARQLLNEGKKVLFSGTACQIAGLKTFLRKEYHNLLTLDVLCHGVPSPKVWKQYLKEKEYAQQEKIEDISFRDKTFGWKTFSVVLQYIGGASYIKKLSEDTFMKLFLSNISLRPSCYDCRFKGMERFSDLSLGDCWGIEKYMPEMFDDKGTSVIVTHSEQGEKIVDEISKRMFIKSAELDLALPPSADSRKSVAMHRNRTKFFSKIDQNVSLDELTKLLNLPIHVRLKRKLVRIIKQIIRKGS